MEHRHIMKYYKNKKVWKHSFANELGKLEQLVVKIVKGMGNIFFFNYINIPSELQQDITYGCIVVY